MSRNIALESEWNVCSKIISVLGKTVLIILDCLVITETDHESYVRKSWFSLRRRHFKGMLLYLYQCKADAPFLFAKDVTMVWLASLRIFTAISTAALQNVSQFTRLLGNFTSAQVRFFILDFNNPFDRRLASICQAIFFNSLSPWGVIACLIESYILRTLVAVSLNYTRLNSLKQKYPIYIFYIPKLSLFVFFIATFINLMAALLALSVEIREMHKTDRAKNSIDLDTINGLLQVFGTTTFRVNLMRFF